MKHKWCTCAQPRACRAGLVCGIALVEPVCARRQTDCARQFARHACSLKRARLCVMGAATAKTPTLSHRAAGFRRRRLFLRLARVLALRGRVSSCRHRLLWHTRAVCPVRVRRSRPRSPSTVSEGEGKGGVRLPNAHALPGASPRQAPLKYASRRRPPVWRPPPRQASPPAPEGTIQPLAPLSPQITGGG